MWKARIDSITKIIGDARGLLPEDGKALMYNYEKLQSDLATANEKLKGIGEIITVAGTYMDRSIVDFRRACKTLLDEEKNLIAPNNALISVLCDAIRLSREFVSIATQHPGRKEEVKEGRRNERRSDYR